MSLGKPSGITPSVTIASGAVFAGRTGGRGRGRRRLGHGLRCGSAGVAAGSGAAGSSLPQATAIDPSAIAHTSRPARASRDRVDRSGDRRRIAPPSWIGRRSYPAVGRCARSGGRGSPRRRTARRVGYARLPPTSTREDAMTARSIAALALVLGALACASSPRRPRRAAARRAGSAVRDRREPGRRRSASTSSTRTRRARSREAWSTPRAARPLRGAADAEDMRSAGERVPRATAARSSRGARSRPALPCWRPPRASPAR